MSNGWVEVAGCWVTQAQLRVLRAIGEAAKAPKIGDFHRATEIRLEKQGLIRRVPYEPGTKIPGWLLAPNGRRVLQALAEADALPQPAEALGRAYERISN